MDVTPPNQHPATSDDELAKVLAGIGANDSPDHPAPQPAGQTAAEAAGLQFEETPGPIVPAGSTNTNNPRPVAPPEPMATPMNAGMATASSMTPVTGELDALKKSALEELRPLVGKLNLPPEDKFDTLLLIIRSTDDQTLLAPAHEAAKAIPDETKRAQALLDVIKEIDYFSQGQQQPVA
jgi:hypothetical protein